MTIRELKDNLIGFRESTGFVMLRGNPGVQFFCLTNVDGASYAGPVHYLMANKRKKFVYLVSDLTVDKATKTAILNAVAISEKAQIHDIRTLLKAADDMSTYDPYEVMIAFKTVSNGSTAYLIQTTSDKISTDFTMGMMERIAVHGTGHGKILNAITAGGDNPLNGSTPLAMGEIFTSIQQEK